MEMLPIDSGTVRAVGYEPPTGGLHIELTDGTLYEFMEVPQDVYDAFFTAPAKDAFVDGVLKRDYRYVQLT
jgi:hypothetical protein